MMNRHLNFSPQRYLIKARRVRSPRVGLPAEARLQRHARSSVPNPAESSHTAAESRSAGRLFILAFVGAPHPRYSQGIHPRSDKEEGDDGEEASNSRLMQWGLSRLPGRETTQVSGLAAVMGVGWGVGGRNEHTSQSLLQFAHSHLVCCSRVGTCHQERAEGLEAAVGGGPEHGTPALLQREVHRWSGQG